MKQKTITVPLIGGSPARVKAWVDPSGTFAIHHTIWNTTSVDGALWTVTHIRTGMALATYMTRHKAGKLVELALESGIDWAQDADYYRAELNNPIHIAFAKTVSEL
jgi:hypothetical protein